MTQDYLCIGGPMDGKTVKTEQYVFYTVIPSPLNENFFSPDHTAKFETIAYHAVKMRDAYGEDTFIYTSGDPKNVLKDLIAGYKK